MKAYFPKSLGRQEEVSKEQRQKGNKPLFFRNNPQGQPILREPRMDEVGGKRPRNTPMQCWGCNGDHK